MAHEDLAVFYESLRLGDDNDQFDTEDLPPQQGQQPLAAGEAPAAGEALQEDAQLMADLDLLLDDAAADPLGAVLGCGCGSCGDGCGSYGNGSGGPSPSCGCGGSGCEASGIAGLCGNHSPPDSSTAAPAVPAAAAAAQPAIQADARAGGQAPATRRQLQWVPKHIEAVLWTAAVFVQLAGQFAGAAVLAAAAWAVKKKQIKPRKVSAREAKYGFSWLTDQVGVVTGWTGAVTVVRLPGDCYAVVPVFCPCCGKVHHSEADWAKYLSIEGNYRVDNPDDPRNKQGHKLDKDGLQEHVMDMSYDLAAFYHDSAPTLKRTCDALGVVNPRAPKRKAAAGASEGVDEAPLDTPAKPAKRSKPSKRV